MRTTKAHPRSLISTFVVRYFDSIIPILANSKNFKTLAGLCSWAGRFESYLVANPEDMFSRDETHMEKSQERDQVKKNSNVSRSMTKPTKCLWAQRRLRSACTSAQSDQSSLSAWRRFGSLATHWAHSEDSYQTGRMQADLSLRWAHMPFCWFWHGAAQVSPGQIRNMLKVPSSLYQFL